MGLRRSRSTLVAALLSAALVGGGVAVIAPAAADDAASYAATNWKKIWKKKIKKYADKRYYTKKQSNSTYASKAELGAALGNYWTKTQSDAAYAPKATTYTKTETYSKTESDAKYAPYPKLIRGSFFMTTTAPAANDSVAADISFGTTFAAAPVAHYVKLGDPVPAGCAGTNTAPDAAAGHLCIFEVIATGTLAAAAAKGVCSPSNVCPGAMPYGAILFGYSSAAGQGQVTGNWAARPAALAAVTLLPSGGTNKDGDARGGSVGQ